MFAKTTKWLLVLILLIPALLSAEWDNLFSEDEDPSLFHHVNVITGNLNLCMQDSVVQGPLPLPLIRTYTSAGALERSPKDVDLFLKNLRRGWLIQGGWSLFPHANLLIQPAAEKKNYKACLAEKSGSSITYVFSHVEGKHTLVLKPDCTLAQSSGSLSARTNPINNLLKIDRGNGEATLCLPDGGERFYKGYPINRKDPKDLFQRFYRLKREILPSQHQVIYEYNKDNLFKITLRNPLGNCVYSWIDFNLNRAKSSFRLQIKTSDDTSIIYRFDSFKKRDYLRDVESSSLPHERMDYSQGRKGIGMRIQTFVKAGKTQFTVSYILPHNGKAEEKWAKHPDQKDFVTDRVSLLETPEGILGKFSYTPRCTEVRDVHNLLTRYRHDGERLTSIEYCDHNNHVASILKFIWDGPRLAAKVKCDSSRRPLFSKTFKYDSLGNVTVETFWGNLTGSSPGPYTLTPNGSLQGAESYTKKYKYLARFNVPILEEEEGGLTYKYTYKPDTNLLTSKLTRFQGRILERAFFEYNYENLLVAEITDDGATPNLSDLGVTRREIKRYTRDPSSGLVTSQTLLCLDLATKQEKRVRTTRYKYSSKRKIVSETVYDAQDTPLYTLYTDYDSHGRITRKTTPVGQENTYSYDAFGKLITSKEVGSPPKRYIYDARGFPKTSIETDTNKITHTTYDAKGRLLKQTDSQGNVTHQTFDTFGRCLQTNLPQIHDQDGNPYTPILRFTYDDNGNLTSNTNPRGETIHTTYNSLRKPLTITHPDGSQTRHTYNKNSTIARTVYPDHTTTHYTYDPYRRKTSQKTYSAEGQLLSQESWTYSTFHLLSHTDPIGLTTTYSYDSAGRKISEQALDRVKTTTYDRLGYPETTTYGESTLTQIHDVAGRVTEQYEQNSENHMLFSYNSDNRKIKARRTTAQGEATDIFTYDSLGRLTLHTDPLGNTTTTHYNESYKNTLGQDVLQKTVTDPLGNAAIDTYDALGHLITTEKHSPDGLPVAKEENTYDLAGNLASRTTTIYQDHQPVKTVTTLWEYDSLGHVTQENEADQKITQYTFDSRGNLTQKILPGGTILDYTYDGLGRLLEQSGSDGTIHYLYTYALGPNPTHIHDLIQNIELHRTYNPFQELIQETTAHNHTLTWKYDNQGRRTRFTLPGNASIAYTYNRAHLHTVSVHTPEGSLAYRHTYTHFDPNGHVAEEQLINNLGTLTTTRDILERPESQTTHHHTHTAAYGPSGLVTSTNSTLLGDKEYTYDPLNQLLTAGEQTYHFDSLGNPTECTTNDCNQILSTPDTTLTYDPNGNPTNRTTPDTTYTYDALGRLTSLTRPNKTVHFTYDPLSRLHSVTTTTSTWFQQTTEKQQLLYDQETDIGTLTQDGTLFQLKVLGLGQKGEIGATIAIEIQGTVYAPLHDTFGNIIALIAPDNTLAETYHIDPFGLETTPSTLNPWRFCSKRSIHNLTNFGLRFYDPTLGRWLTPDPSSLTDSPNLYLYALNSPLNRLDLFGLSSDPNFPTSPHLWVPVPEFNLSHLLGPFPAQFEYGKIKVDLVASAGENFRLSYSAEELAVGRVDLLDNPQFISKDGSQICVNFFVNGIMNNSKDFNKTSRFLNDTIGEGTLFIGIHNPTEGIQMDLARATREKLSYETPITIALRQMLVAFSERFNKVNPNALMHLILHSEAGPITKVAIKGMTQDQQETLQKQLIVTALAPFEPIPLDIAHQATNLYSSNDHITGPFAKPFVNDPNYDIHFIPCTSPWKEKTLFLTDHAILGHTLRTSFKKQSDSLRTKHGFYNGQTR